MNLKCLHKIFYTLLTLIFSFIIITWQMIEGNIYVELDALLITASFAPKALQKFAEASLYASTKLSTGSKRDKIQGKEDNYE